ncbi:MAG: SufD family Fe-S cluster assembly protein [Candidatus Chromulinivorax sp.]|nr:SufD family Fe-S cluster assembly protein [Candidatus Chromulinivorax sp.]
MDFTINFYSCIAHQIQIDQTQILALSHDVDITLDSQENYNFVIPTKYQGVVNLVVTQSVAAEITLFCADAVDVTVRLIILFPQIADIDVSVMICGDHSNVTILGMCAIAEQQVVTIKTKQIHCGKHSKSRVIMQGLITGCARFAYDGMIRIEKDACGTYALQNNKNILLSSTATAISIPNIEVLHHDVQCYHGAAIGKFNAHQMHYMQSRGLNEVKIQQLLVQELFAQVLQGYEKREFILQRVYEKI